MKGSSGFPRGQGRGAWEAGLLSVLVGDQGSTLAPEQTRAGIQSDPVRDLAGEPRKCSGVRGLGASSRVLEREESHPQPQKGKGLQRDSSGGSRDLM